MYTDSGMHPVKLRTGRASAAQRKRITDTMFDYDKYDNYIFDLYGTLIWLHTDEHAPQTWKKWLRRLDGYGIAHPDYIRFRKEFFDMDRHAREVALAEGPFEVPEIDVVPIYEELFEKYRSEWSRKSSHRTGANKPITVSHELVLTASYAFRAASYHYIRLYPSVPEFLAELHRRGKKVYILSNAQASYTLPEIRMFGLDAMVDDYIMSSDEKVMKPDPAFFNIMIDKHHMVKSRTVMIGDSRWSDVGGAQRAGIDSIWLHGDNAADKFYVNALS